MNLEAVILSWHLIFAIYMLYDLGIYNLSTSKQGATPRIMATWSRNAWSTKSTSAIGIESKLSARL